MRLTEEQYLEYYSRYKKEKTKELKVNIKETNNQKKKQGTELKRELSKNK